MKNKIIIFSGLDCSGKSTQIMILKKTFTELGIKTFVFWSRGGYTPNIQRCKNLFRFFFKSFLPPVGNSPRRDKLLYKTGLIKKLWINLAIIDLIFYYSIFLRYKKFNGYSIICDRFIYDTQLDFQIAFPDYNLERSIFWILLKKIAIHYDYYFISVVPVSLAIERSKHKFEPYPDTPEVLEIRKNNYLDYCRTHFDVIFIDGTKEVQRISKLIEKTIFS
jgi:thymidylate kinase